MFYIYFMVKKLKFSIFIKFWLLKNFTIYYIFWLIVQSNSEEDEKIRILFLFT